MQVYKKMNIQSVKFANIFKSEVAQAVVKMLDEEEEFREVDTIKGFIVSRSDSYIDNLLNVFSGEALELKNIKKIYLFFK